MRGFISGGAPLRRETQEFIFVYAYFPLSNVIFRILKFIRTYIHSIHIFSVFGVPIAQGYGLTETAAGGTLGLYWDSDMHGRIGPPLSCLDIKLIDVPEMGYLHTNSPPQGEIAIKGFNVFPGYYKDPEMT